MAANPVVQAIFYPFTAGSGNLAACATITNATAPYAQTVTTGRHPYSQVGTTNEDIQSAILLQPVSVGVDASSRAFHNYSGGIFTDTNCGTTIDHAILAVGWGNDPTYGNYWIVEN
jgi:hypothetical protein